MRILKLPPYGPPEQTSSAHLTNDLNKALVQAGFVVENYIPTPTRGVSDAVRRQYKKIKYEEFEGGKVIIHRFSLLREGKNPILRALRYFLCHVIHYHKGIRAKKIDLVYGGSTPPTQGVLCTLVAKKLSKKQGKKVPFIYNLQDVFPDSLETAGLSKKNSLFYKIGTKIADYTYRNADAIIVISNDIKDNIMAKGVPEEKIHVIYNWINTDKVRPVKPADNRLYEELGLSRDTFKVVYAGNLGLAQGIDTLLDTAKALQDNKNIEFIIFGKGVQEDNLKKRAMDEKLTNVRFFPLLPAERVPEVYSLADACVVCCKAGTGGAGVPSKTWTIMACGRPLLVSFDIGSELCRTIEAANAGLCSPAGDSQALMQNVLQMYGQPEQRLLMGSNARDYAVQFAGKEKATAKYVAVLSASVQQKENVLQSI